MTFPAALAACFLFLTACSAQKVDDNSSSAGKQEAVSLESGTDKVSYGIGMDIGTNLRAQEIDINVQALYEGLAASYAGQETRMTQEESREVLMAFQQELMKKQQEQAAAEAAENLAEGEKFLEENKEREGVVVLPSGLQYEVLEEGSGESPVADDFVQVHYRGMLTNGTEFDSSYAREKPATFPVNGVIRGWTEALQLMKPGAKWKLYVPADLAYGDRQAGPMIKPNSALVFDVELLSVLDEEEMNQPSVAEPQDRETAGDNATTTDE
jgi:FKBP-type peptidyl-prolyl cis-trans isomerase FklB